MSVFFIYLSDVIFYLKLMSLVIAIASAAVMIFLSTAYLTDQVDGGGKDGPKLMVLIKQFFIAFLLAFFFTALTPDPDVILAMAELECDHVD